MVLFFLVSVVVWVVMEAVEVSAVEVSVEILEV